jgi:tetratricopeptide (TPR) repeat protein
MNTDEAPPAGDTEDDDDQQIAFETPPDALAHAKTLIEAGDNKAALDLLTVWRDEWLSVPPAYDAMIGRCALREGDATSAVYYLTHASDAYGDRMPPAQRRDFATALILVGRAEAAGRELSQLPGDGASGLRPAHRAALAAFAEWRTGAPDSGPPTPYRVLAQAQALTDRKDLETARVLLAEALSKYGRKWGDLPVEYEALLGRLSLRYGDREAALTHLTRARAMSGASVPINISQPLGTALFETARFGEAGRELDQAQRDGAPIGRADLLIAINAFRRQTGSGEMLDTTFARNLTLIDPDRHLAYVAIPKNACSLLKATFVLNGRDRDAYLASGETIHRFCGVHMANTIASEIPSGPGSFRFVVLRNPLLRILSAYLDKIVRGRHKQVDPYTEMQVARAVREAQAALGLQDDPARSISFEEFARYLATTTDVQLDMHWMPQVQMVGTDLSRYDHVGTVERLSETLELLASRFGFVAASSLDPRLLEENQHITKYSENADLKQPYRALPHELDAFRDGVPMPDLFFTPELKALLEQRYAADMALYARV